MRSSEPSGPPPSSPLPLRPPAQLGSLRLCSARFGSEGPSSINQLGGVYTNGCPLPPCKRQSIILLAARGVRSTDISRSLQVSNGCVSKILSRYYRTGSVRPKSLRGGKARAVPPPVVARIAQLKRERPSLFAWEIRQQLRLEGLCGNQSSPSVSSINRVLRALQGALSPTVLPGGENAGMCTHVAVHAHLQASPSSPITAAEPQPPPGPPPGRSRQRSRTTLSQQQSKALEEEFQRGKYPDSSTRGRLAAATRLPDITIQVWFSNRRAKWRREARQGMEANGAGESPQISLMGCWLLR
ncbi:paired box protein Pax-4 [Tympanuchus pallidicinctus]|uniref:paired box protein Pax-4 n=1 Tax=Tympanuchus pallidicinctus TaxID=109042 RepID=UPI002286EA4E|nr:paired box protein Pax-4 [Tympanuchus pallidicinctus]